MCYSYFKYKGRSEQENNTNDSSCVDELDKKTTGVLYVKKFVENKMVLLGKQKGGGRKINVKSMGKSRKN